MVMPFFRRQLLRVTACTLGVSACATAEVSLQVVADREMPIYRCGQEVVFRISATEDGAALAAAELEYRLKLCSRSDLVLRSGTIELGEQPVNVEATLDEPGFLYLSVSGKFAGKTLRAAAGAGFEPERIAPLNEEPADFDRFWAEGRERQAACPPVELETLEAHSTDTRTCYLVKVPTPDGQTVYGFLSEPTAPGRYPATVNLPGAGPGVYTPDTSWPDEGVVALRMNVHAYRPGSSSAAMKELYTETYGSELNYLRQNTVDREKHVYRRSHLAISRAIDFLAARPNVDAGRIVAYGSSQGGTLGVAMAALNPHLKAVAALVPGFGDHHGFLSGRSNSHLLYPVKDDPAKLEMAKTVSGYYDSIFFARRIRIPLLMSAGYIDTTCTPASVYAIYNQVPGVKRMIDSPLEPHRVSKPLRAEMMAFVREQLGLTAVEEEADR